MRYAKTIFQFYINSSTHVALAVCALVGVTEMQLDFDVGWAFWAVVFFGSITGYNFVKYPKVAGLHHRSLTNSLKTIQVFSFVCFLGLLIFSFRLSVGTLLCLLFLGFLTLLYAVPLYAQKNLRSTAGLKVLIVVLVWAGVTVAAPVVEAGAWSLATIMVFVQRMLVVVVLTLPFEIRDYRYDKPQLRTLPHQLGVKQSKLLGYLLVAVVLLLQWGIDRGDISGWLGVIGLAILLILGLYFATPRQLRYYASFWVEAIPMGWLALLWLAG
jgi:hypothetical protein